jgi:hypothetical protein
MAQFLHVSTQIIWVFIFPALQFCEKLIQFCLFILTHPVSYGWDCMLCAAQVTDNMVLAISKNETLF